MTRPIALLPAPLIALGALIAACGTESAVAVDSDAVATIDGGGDGSGSDGGASDAALDTGDTALDTEAGDAADTADTSADVPVDAGDDGADDAFDAADSAEDTTDAEDTDADAFSDPDDGSDAADADATDPDVSSDSDAAADADADTGPTGVECGRVTCAPGEVCARGICRAPDGTCGEDGVCAGDAWCCGDACSDPTACIPWASGQVRDFCIAEVDIGVFTASTQCEWAGPPEGDPWPEHRNVLGTPLVANLPYRDRYSAEVVFVSYNFNDGGAASGVGSTPAYYGVIRVLDGDSCAQLETIADAENPLIGASAPAIGDLDGDGFPDIVAQRAVSGLVAFRWNDVDQRFERLWVSSGSGVSGSTRWDGPALHDLDDDGVPEVISGSEVFDSRTGARLNPGQAVAGAAANVLSVVVNVDDDPALELVAGAVHEWDPDTSRWVLEHTGGAAGRHYAAGDFGTDTGAGFDRSTRDGIAEIVITGNDIARIVTLDGDVLLDLGALTGGGPPTVADFDNDGRAEFATAGGNAFRVFDLDCAGPGPDCLARHIRWSQPSQDLSSRTTGSSIFDFDGDGQAEAVYGDECFTRIYDGSDGTVLFSAFRTSCTWYENPVVADTDADGSAEIVVGTNSNCSIACPALDPIHPGIPCAADPDCPLGTSCGGGLCRCTTSEACGLHYECAAPIDGSAGLGNVCRASHPPGVGLQGVRVLRDGLDRWASSRPTWNQHVFWGGNIDDGLRVPRTSETPAPFATDAANSFRANAQGAVAPDEVPDATARASGATCTRTADGVRFAVPICNRGARAIGTGLPFAVRSDETLICTGATTSPLAPGTCVELSCEAESSLGGALTVTVNDDGTGRGTTVECEARNNRVGLRGCE